MRSLNGGLAQLVEQLTLNQRVVGSSPAASTIQSFDGDPETFVLGVFFAHLLRTHRDMKSAIKTSFMMRF